ncbi:BTAD domain-containing putative transcriptional regulator [Kitasatospora sp. NPDC004669]|uniref:AfsR/SARP family transcriptional regulator n=1 Tax=Kitasatospora sp. NPDC004669 TaxID=3154555 RepID=UPI0033B49B41
MPEPGRAAGWRFAVLGPMRAWHADVPLELGRPQQQAVLAALLLSTGHQVSRNGLLKAVWGEPVPSSAAVHLRTLVARLRAILTAPDGGSPLVSTVAGHTLGLEPSTLDLHVFEGLLASAGRARAGGRPEHAADQLERALALPRGEVLAGLPGPFAEIQRIRLAELVLAAEHQRVGVGLDLGRHAQLVGPLEELVARHPLHEHLRELLMLALYRCGRQSEAIGTYHAARRHLAEGLGVDPGPGLRDLYGRILRADPTLALSPIPGPAGTSGAPTVGNSPPDDATRIAPGPAPTSGHAPGTAPLPRPAAAFVARPEQWDRLEALSTPPGHNQPPQRVAVVAGPAGSGKTTLTVAWAHAVADRYPDGVLYADLRGFDPDGPADTSHLLHTLLRALGMPDHQIPADPAARATSFRRHTGERRVLVIWDNVARADDIAPMLPHAGPSLTVAVSRHALTELVTAHHAAFVPVGTLTPTAAHELLRARLGDARALADPSAARRLAELCDHLPLALSIALARLTVRPAWSVADLVEELDEEHTRLTTLEIGAKLSVQRELDLSRRLLPDTAARLLPLLALHPGAQNDPHIAAALLDTPLTTAKTALAALADLHLLAEPYPGRFQAHDLTRLHARHLLEEEVTDLEREAAIRRLVDYYLAATSAATTQIFGDTPYLYQPHSTRPIALPRLTDIRAALSWWAPEAPAIRALIDARTRAGDFDHAWQLTNNACGYYICTDQSAWLEIATTGLRTAEQSTDPTAPALAHTQLGIVLGQLHRPTEALPHLQRALDIHPPRNPHRIITLGILGGIHHDLNRPHLGDQCLTEALDSALTSGDQWLEAFVLLRLCVAQLTTAPPGQTLQRARRARKLLADRPLTQQARGSILFEALALDGLGRTSEAETTWRELLDLSSDTGDHFLLGQAHAQYAAFLTRHHRHDEAAHHQDTAIALHRSRNDLRTAIVLADRVAGLGRSGQIISIEKQ